MLHLVVINKKRKEKKRNINNDLANLPSHDKFMPGPLSFARAVPELYGVSVVVA